MKTSQWRRAVENRCVFSARLKALFDRSAKYSAGSRRFHVAGPLNAKLRGPVAVRVRRRQRFTHRWHGHASVKISFITDDVAKMLNNATYFLLMMDSSGVGGGYRPINPRNLHL